MCNDGPSSSGSGTRRSGPSSGTGSTISTGLHYLGRPRSSVVGSSKPLVSGASDGVGSGENANDAEAKQVEGEEVGSRWNMPLGLTFPANVGRGRQS